MYKVYTVSDYRFPKTPLKFAVLKAKSYIYVIKQWRYLVCFDGDLFGDLTRLKNIKC